MSEAAAAHTTQTNEASSKPSHEDSSKPNKSANEDSSKPTNEESSKPTNEASSEPSDGASSQPTDGSSSKPTNEASSQSTDGASSQSTATRDCSTDASRVRVRTVKVTNVSLKTNKVELTEFFSFSGHIQHVELQKESDTTQLAFVTYKDPQGAETALCLSGAMISDLRVTIIPVEDYQLPPDAAPLDSDKNSPSNVYKAEDVVTTMLARGFVLGKDTLNKAKEFDEQHQLTSKASDSVVSIDRRIGFSKKLSIGTAAVNEKAREVDQKYQVSEKTKQAYQVAEEKATSAGNAIMNNRYVMTGAAWVSNAYSAVAKAAEDMSVKTKEKVEKAELERQERLAAMSPVTRGKVEKAEQEKAAEEAKAKENAEKADENKSPKTKENAEKAGESKSPKTKENAETAGENKNENANKEKNVPDGSPPAATNPSNSGDSKGASK